MKFMAKKMGVENPKFDRAHDVFADVGRVDIHPFKAGARGFALVLEGRTALYFIQEDDHFIYKGYEMGDFDKGDITLFDKFRH